LGHGVNEILASNNNCGGVIEEADYYFGYARELRNCVGDGARTCRACHTTHGQSDEMRNVIDVYLVKQA
jgi:hypothetical protein